MWAPSNRSDIETFCEQLIDLIMLDCMLAGFSLLRLLRNPDWKRVSPSMFTKIPIHASDSGESARTNFCPLPVLDLKEMVR